MDARFEVAEALSQLSLFADLGRPQLEALAHSYDEELFGEGQRVLRQGLTGSGLFFILEGEAAVTRDGEEVARLTAGDFFGEVSVLADEPPTADVVATTMLRCLVVPRPDVEPFLLDRPEVMLRMLRVEAARLRAMLEWRA